MRLKECCGQLTVNQGGTVTGGGKVSLIDPKGLLLVNGCVTGKTSCLNAAQVSVAGQVAGCTTTVKGTSVSASGTIKGSTTTISGTSRDAHRSGAGLRPRPTSAGTGVQLGGSIKGGAICVKAQGALCQGSTILGKSASLTSGCRITQVGTGLVKACTVKLLSSKACTTVGTSSAPLAICSTNVTIDPASAFVKDGTDPTALSLTTAKGCLSFNAPKCFNVTFNGTCQKLSGNSPSPVNLTVNVTCSNIKIGCVTLPGSTVSLNTSSKTAPDSILCGGGKVVAATLNLNFRRLHRPVLRAGHSVCAHPSRLAHRAAFTW